MQALLLLYMELCFKQMVNIAVVAVQDFCVAKCRLRRLG